MENKFTINTVLGTKQEVFLKFGKYDNGRHAIELIETEMHTPYARATVNTPEIACLLDNQIIIKNYSENKDMVDFFIENKLIEEDYGNFYVGHGGECCICKMTDKLQQLIKEN